jgi:LPXTG-site transpeptidase (sortase) family protein
MIDNVIRPAGAQRQGGAYRPVSSGSPLRSQPRVHTPTVVTVPPPAPLPIRQDIIPPAPKVTTRYSVQPIPVATPRPAGSIRQDPGSGYTSVEVDEVFKRIAELEAESPIVPAIGPVDTAATAATLVQEPVIRAPRIAHKHPKKQLRAADKLWYGGSILLVIGVLSVTGYISVDTWLTNQQVKQVVAEKQESIATTGGMTLGEGEDETAISAQAISSYSVAADLPKRLTIDTLKVNARILPMSVTASGAMQAPVNIYDSGWYSASAKPGNPGAAVIDAHASGATRQGLFGSLDKLAAGDQLSIERGDGQKFTYKVTHTEVVGLNDVDMAKLLKPYGTATEGVNLITCTGNWLEEQKTFDKRVIVYTQRI